MRFVVASACVQVVGGAEAARDALVALQVKEIANGRVAMLEIAGVIIQAAAGQGSALGALSSHLSGMPHNTHATVEHQRYRKPTMWREY